MSRRIKLLCCITVLLAGCCSRSLFAEPTDESVDSAAGIDFFEKHVRPILVEHCLDCHAGEEINGGLSMDSREAILIGGDSGAAAVPHKPDSSRLMEAISYENRDFQMPPQNKLPDAQIAILRKWIEMGLPDPRTAEHVSTAPTGMSIEEGREFWSFRPVSDPAVPEVAQSDWVQQPIDAFVLAQMEREGIVPAPAAKRRNWLRRVTLNLTGLPPTVSELQEFQADESPEAFARVVDRLLASPQYGVHWGRHWLDVARYADSNGLDENLAFGNAWRYRDYVVNAFNEDKAFDEFVVEQIAGDLLPNATRESKIAMGFLALGARVLAEPDMEKLVMDTIDEQVDTTGKAFLGMTFGCSRCHDHKFDPIKQSDYYSLAAIFKSTKTFADSNTGAIKHWFEFSFATDEEKESLKAVDAEIKKLKGAATSFKNAEFARIRAAARDNAAKYLQAAAVLPDFPTLPEAEVVAAEYGLHPRILHHCCRHLQFHRNDDVFRAWHQHREDPAAVLSHYEDLFNRADEAWKTAQSQKPPVKVLADSSLQAAHSAVFDNSGFLAVPPKVQYAFSEEAQEEFNRLSTIARIYESKAADETAAMGVSEGEVKAELPIHIRGSHLNLGEPVAREFPAVMRTAAVRPVFPSDESGRLELARWIASTQHPLTARVFVNRVWGWHFGQPLVGTTENFGRLGDRPSHPLLLDWLARQFMESGWKVKDLHRTILLSSVYRMSVAHPDPAACEAVDPENRLLWKFPMRRMTAEQIRDSLLAVSGRLDASLGGKTVPLRNRQFVFNHTSEDHTKYDGVRRSIYLPVIRNNLYSFFEQFDFPDPTMPTGLRGETVIAPQALVMMNAPVVVNSAEALAEELIGQHSGGDSTAKRVLDAYQRVLCREPKPEEFERSVAFIEGSQASKILATGLSPEDERHVWMMFCQSLFASNEFLYIQ